MAFIELSNSSSIALAPNETRELLASEPSSVTWGRFYGVSVAPNNWSVDNDESVTLVETAMKVTYGPSLRLYYTVRNNRNTSVSFIRTTVVISPVPL